MSGIIINPYSYAGASYLLDDYGADVWAASSLRKLSSTYAGFVIKIWRDADGAEANLSFDSDETVSLDSSITPITGGVTATNLGEFVADAGYPDPDGLGAPATAGVMTWYDQTGNSRDFTYAGIGGSWVHWNIYNNVAGFRVVDINGTDFPAIYETYKPTIVFVHGAPYTSRTQPRSIFSVTHVKTYAGPVTSAMKWHTSTYDHIRWYHTTSKFQLMQSEGGIVEIESTDTFTQPDTYLCDYIYNETPGTTTMHINGGIQGSSTTFVALSNALGYAGIILDTTSNVPPQPEFMENIVYFADKTVDGSGIRDNINSYYGIY